MRVAIDFKDQKAIAFLLIDSVLPGRWQRYKRLSSGYVPDGIFMISEPRPVVTRKGISSDMIEECYESMFAEDQFVPLDSA